MPSLPSQQYDKADDRISDYLSSVLVVHESGEILCTRDSAIVGDSAAVLPLARNIASPIVHLVTCQIGPLLLVTP